MDAQQKTRLLAVIDRDAEIQNRYVNMHGQFCVLGGMMSEVGVDVKQVFYRKGGNTIGIGAVLSTLTEVGEKLDAGFGLTAEQLNTLQEINDATANRGERQNALRAQVETFAVVEV